MKTALTLLLLVAASSALPFQLNQLLPDLPQKTNTLDGSDSAVGANEASDKSAFDASSYTNQPIPAAIAPNGPQKLAFAAGDRTATFGALLANQESSSDGSAGVKQEKNAQPSKESFAKQFSSDQQQPYGTAFGTQAGGSPAQPFGASPGGQQSADQQQTTFGGSSTSQFGGNQPSGFGVPSDDQFRGNQPGFGVASPAQFGANQQSDFGASAGSQFSSNQQPVAGAPSSAQFGANQQSDFGASAGSQFSSNQQPGAGASSSSQFGGSEQSGFGSESGDQFGGSQPPAFGAPSNLDRDGSQQPDFGVSGSSQFGGNQQSGPGAAPETQFGGNQQPGFGSNFANEQNPAAGSSGPFNVELGDEYYIRTALPFAGYRPTKYTSLDLSQVNFQNVLRSSGHEEYISVPGDDTSDEAEVYRLVGVAPASAVQGGAARVYSANIGASVPVYRELDDVYEERRMMEAFGANNPQASVYSAMANSRGPVRVKAEATLAGGNLALLLDD